MADSNMIQKMIATMVRNGWRITDQRRTLAGIFADSEHYLSPKDVYDLMKNKYPGVSFDTVYRNLRMLSEMGALEQFYFLDGGLKFRSNCADHHHHHLICTNCEKTLTFDYCPMEKPLQLPGNYRIVGHRFEVYGICGDCREEVGEEPITEPR